MAETQGVLDAETLIPFSWNVIAALFVIQFVYTWNMFLWPSLIIGDESKQVVQFARCRRSPTSTAHSPTDR